LINLDSPDDLTPIIYRRIVYDHEAVAPSDTALRRVENARRLFLRHLESGAICYGVNTGCGAQVGVDLTEDDKERFSRHILLGRSVAVGAPFPVAVVRGAMLVRLVQFLTGHNAVSADLCQYLAARLNDRFTPYVPSMGLGMAGEIIPLCHLAQTLIGEGFVLADDGARIPAATALKNRGVAPYQPLPKEGMSLINGVAMGSAASFNLGDQIHRTLALATLTAAASIEGIGASVEAFGDDVARLRPEPGLASIANTFRALLGGTEISRLSRQAPISFRTIPHIHGTLLQALAELQIAATAEWRTVSDNPAFIPDDSAPNFGRLVHSGNFHCGELTHRVEATALSLAQVAAASERRLHRLLDQRFSGLTPQLARRPGLDTGLVVLHKAVQGLLAHIRSLSVPPSLQHGESSFGQEDIETMLFPALDRLAEVNRIARLVSVYELYTALVAIDERGEKPGNQIQIVRDHVRAQISPYEGDRPFGPEIESLAAMVEANDFPLPDSLLPG
jgi:histidine ammonia-lyase